jgi:hypothetical protein
VELRPPIDPTPWRYAVLTFEELIRRSPLIHNNRTKTWSIHPELAGFLDRVVGSETIALETGSGLSTLVILRKGPRLHVAVQPVADEFAVIAEFAEEHAIDTRAFRPVVARSQDYLPTAETPALDLVLIDGDHSFPTPFVDWFYTADRLKAGGLMIVDDINVGTGTILAAFMEADPKWEQVFFQPERFAVYRKRVEHVHLGDWVTQPFLRDAFPTAAVRLVQSEEKAAEHALEEALETTQTLLGAAQGERDETAAAARNAMERIVAMESTKFWKARRVWFRARRFLGLPGHE